MLITHATSSHISMRSSHRHSSACTHGHYSEHLINQSECMLHLSCYYEGHTQPCQNVPATSNFAPFSQFLAAHSTLDFTRSPLVGKGTWCLLPTTPSMLPTASKHFDRAAHYNRLTTEKPVASGTKDSGLN